MLESHRIVGFWTALILCLAPAASSAEDNLSKAVEFTLKMDYPQALKLATQALKSSSSGPEELAKAYEIQGMCLASMGKMKKAVQAFRRLLAINPAFRFGENISPKIAEPFDQALTESKGQKKIALAHQPPEKGPPVNKLELQATLVADPLSMVKKVRIRFRADKSKERVKGQKVKGPGPVAIKLPKKLKPKEISYYFEAINKHGGVLARAGSQSEPFVVHPLPPPVVAKASPVVKKIEPKIVPPPATIPPPEKKPMEEEENGAGAWYEQWWLWTGVGVLVTGAVVAVALAAGGEEPGGPLRYYVYIK